MNLSDLVPTLLAVSVPAPRQAAAKQLAFDELDISLHDTTFVVVNLETTGTSPDSDAITGITTAMVYAAPPIEAVLPGFLEFATGAVLVAHNARFDMAFLRAAATPHGQPRRCSAP